MTIHRETEAAPALLAPRRACAALSALFGGAVPVVAAEDWLEAMRASVEDAPRDAPRPASLAVAAREALALVDPVAAPREKSFDAARAVASRIGVPTIEGPAIDEKGVADPQALGRLCGAAFAVASARLAEARRDLAAARAASAALRREIDALQASFLALDGFVQALGLAQTALGLLIEPGEDSVALEARTDGAPSRLVQRLPVSARALVAVDLWCADPPEGAGAAARLTARLEDLAGACLGEAALPLDALAAGWNRLALPVALDCSDRDVALVLALDGAPTGLALGLGRPTPVARLRVADGRSGVADSPLAMRLWRGLPGSAAATVGGHGARRARPSDLPRPRTLRCPDQAIGFEPVQYWEKENAVLVHPPAHGVTYGLIERTPLGPARRVTAVVHNAHAEAPPMRFAIGVAPAGYGARLDPATTLGTWIALPALAWGEAHAFAETLSGDSVDLILAAMVAEGESNRFGWALFRSFRACATDL